TTGTKQNVPLTVTYETLKTLSGADDADGTTVKIQITQLDSGKLTVTRMNVAGTAYVSTDLSVPGVIATPIVLDPGESVVWTPAVNAISSGATPTLAAFRFKAFDSLVSSSAEAAVKVKVDAVNQAPSMSLAASYNATRNTALSISFTDLADKLAVSDFEDVTGVSPKAYNAGMKFRIEDILNGSISKGGTQLSVGSTFDATETISYSAGNNVTGIISAFKVSVQDKDGLGSSQIATVTVSVSGNNAPPTVAVSTATLSAGKQKQAYTISYGTLASALTLADADSATKMFVITNISAGQLFNGATLVTAHATAPNQTPTPVSSTRLLVGETLTFIPDAATVGLTEIFQVRGYDGVDFSNNVRVSVNFAPTYTVPAISSVADFTGLTQAQAFTFTYDDLKLKSDVVSPDANSTYPVKFRITALGGSGTIQRTSGTAETMDLSSLSKSLIASGETFVITPTAGIYGRFKGFSIKAYQENASGSPLESVNSVDVNFVAGKVNSIPTFTAAGTALAGGAEDTPYVISYNALMANYPGSDNETGVLKYQVIALSNAAASYSRQYFNGAGNRVTAALTNADLPIDIGPGESIIYSPVLNDATATQDVVSVKLKDGDGALSAAAKTVQLLVTSVNDAPTYGAISSLPSTTKNVSGGLTISYATLKTAVNVVDPDTAANSIELLSKTAAADVDDNVVTFQVTYLESGSFTVGGTSYSTTGALASPVTIPVGGSLVWRPAANATGTGASALSAFRIKANDGALSSATEALIKVNVSSENQAPSLAANPTYPVTRNTALEKTLSELALNLNVSDLESVIPADPISTRYNNIKLKITGVSNGTVKIGTSASTYASATAWAAGSNDVVDATNAKLFWMPPTEASETTIDAFTVVVVDAGGLLSPTYATVKAAITGSNLAPTIAAITKDYTGATQNNQFTLSFNTLKTDLSVADTDSSNVTLVFTNISNGSLMKGGTALQAVSWTPTTLPNSDNQLMTYETLSYLPSYNLIGQYAVFKVRAWDGVQYSANEATVRVTIAAVNQAPVLTRVRDFSGGVKNIASTFSYDDLRGDPAITDGTQRTDASDAEEALPTKTLKFKVKAITSGTLTRTAGGTLGSLSVGDLISPSEQFSWSPANNAMGRLNAFSVVAFDGTTESVQSIPVYFNYVDSNQPPTFLTNTFLSGAKEDVPYVITYSMLATAYPGLDDRTSVLGYKVADLTSAVGTLSKNGSAVTSASLATTPVVVYPGDYLIWTPAANANSGNAGTRFKLFTLKLVDADNSVSVASKDVESTLAAINDAPTYGSATTLAQTTKNKAGGQGITYANIAAAIPTTDIDGDTVSYRIETVGSGTLRLGASNTGTVVNPAVSMPQVVASGADGINTVSDLNWTPPLNGEGNFLVMTVRAYDGTEYAATTQEVRINVQPGNSNPTVVNTAVTLGTAAGTSGTTQNGALPVSYNTLLSTSGAVDPDGSVVTFKIMSLQSGSVVVGNTTYTAANLPTTSGSELTIGAGESFVWRPATNVSGSAKAAFTVRAFDGANTSAAVAYSANVSAINQAPGITNVTKLYTSGLRNQYFKVSFATLAADLALTDAEDIDPNSPSYNVMKLRIEQGGAGTEIRVGTSNNASEAILLSDANRQISVGTNVFWMPPANRTGDFEAFVVAAVDSNGASSPMTSTVSVTVTGANAAPKIDNDAAKTYSLGSTPQARPISLTYAQLSSALNVSDVDNTYRPLVLTSAPNASLVKGSTTLIPTSVTGSTAPITAPLPANASIIAPNESVVVYPVPSAVGNGTTLFTVRAWDGEQYSITVGTVTADLTSFNQIPTLTRVGEFNGVVKNTAFNFTYDTLRGDPTNTTTLQRTDAYDAEEALPTKTLKFKITRLESGTLVRTGGTTGAIAINSLINPGDSFSWTPPTNVLGAVDGFGIVAVDAAGAESSPDKTVKFIVSAPNVKPSFASTNFLTGAYEDIPFNISYSTLSSNYAGTDDSTTVLKYRITSLTGADGTLSRNGLAITSASLPLTLLPNDVITWTPAANVNSGAGGVTPLYKPFTMVLVDNEGLESDPVDLRVSVASVNDIPTLANNSALTAVAKNTGRSITHADLFAALQYTDNDFAGGNPTASDISYRIESVRSGVLRKSSGDVALNIVSSDTSSMPMLVNSGANGSTRLSSVYWTPALNAEGSQIVVTVRAFDGVDYSASTTNVTITVTPGNSAPTITTTALTLGAAGTSTSGTSQNGQLPVTYQTLLDKSGATDSDENVIWFKITALATGKLRVSGTEYASLPGTALYVKPGETVTWMPAANASGVDASALQAFSVKAFDGTAESSNALVLKANVSASNQAPSLAASWTYAPAGDTRNKYIKISFADLVSNLNVADFEDVPASGANRFDTMRLKVEQMVNGQSLTVGTGATSTGSVEVSAGNNNQIFGVGSNLFWLPPAGKTGTIEAFRLTALDTQNASTPLVASVFVTVSGSNSVPTMSAVTREYNFGNSPQGTPLVVTYATLKTAFGLDDTDSPLVNMVVTSINNSTLKKGGSAITANTIGAGSTTAPAASSIISLGETVVIYPNANASGAVTFFTVRAWDGEAYSDATTGEGSVKATLTAVNQAPGLTYVKDFTGGSKNNDFLFSYSDLRGNPAGTPGVERTNAFDPEEALPTTTLKFKIKGFSSGTLYKMVGSPAAPQAVAVNDTIDPGTNWKWVPPTDSVGRLLAFSVVAFDGSAESSSTVPVYFQYSSPNTAPAFVNATNPDISGAFEDVPFNISYAMLASKYPATDDQAGPVRYRITETIAANGKLYLNGNELVNAVSLPINLSPGQSVTWVPALYTNSPTGLGISAFKIKLIDDDGVESTTNEQTVKVIVAPVNNIPVLNSNTALTPALAKNAGRTITHADIFAAIKFKDYDFVNGDPSASDISFRIEGVNSGDLRKSNGGTAIVPVSTTPASMPTLVNSGANGADKLSSVYWTPANNASGTQVVMTIRGFDGVDYSATATTVTISVNTGNVAPVIVNSTHTMGQGGTSGTSQNGQLPITYDILKAKANATDSDDDVIWFKISSIDGGSLKVGGTTYTTLPGTALYVKPNETVVWSPATNAVGSDAAALAAFTVQAYDQTTLSTNSMAVKVNVSAVKQIPTLNAAWTHPTAGNRNDYKMLTYAEMASGLNVLDVEDAPSTTAVPARYNTMRLRIEQLVDGQEIRIGTTSNAQDASPLVINGTSNIIGLGMNVFWKPPAGLTGTFTAFRVTAVDTDNLSSPTMADVKVTVTGSNAAPYMNAAARTFNYGATPQGVPFLVTYDNLKNTFDIRDADSPYLVFVITSMTDASLKKGPVSMVTTSPVNGITPLGTSVIAANESVVVFPTVSKVGDATELFRVRVFDGEVYSDATTDVGIIKADLKVNNQVPTLTYVKNFTGVNQGGQLLFTYADFRGNPSNTSGSERTNAFDAEENIPTTQSLMFKVKSINAGNGTLYKKVGASYNAASAGDTIDPGAEWKWTPAGTVVGTIPAFSVVAWDGTAESASSVTVNVEVTATNVAPSFVSTTNFAGAAEDIPYKITYALLANNFPGTDDQASPLNYEVTAISGGKLYKGATELTAGAGNLPATILPTDTLTWVPPSLTSGLLQAFTIRLKDNAGSYSATSPVVSINVAAVNNLPVMGTAGAFPNTGANAITGPLAKDVGIAMSYDQLANILPVTDADYTGGTPTAGDITYRIESVNSGVLYLGTNNSGEVITPSYADFANMKRIVKTGANNTSTTSNVFWKPPVNGSGTFSVMSVRAFDGTDYSATVREVFVTIASSNAAPVWSNTIVTNTYNVTLSTGTSQNGALPITYDTLLAATSPTDADGNIVKFKISNLSSGSLTVAGTTYSTVGTIATPPSVGPGESIVWRPGTDAVGSPLSAFKIVATDNVADNANPVTVRVNVSGVNQAPTINATWTVGTGTTRNTYKVFTFQEIAEGLGVLDFEDANSSVLVASRFTNMKLRIEQMVAGQEIRIGTTNNAASSSPLDNSNRVITPSKYVFWMPPANRDGTMEAFRVSAIDTGNLSSAQMGTVYIPVSGTNAVPYMNAASKVYSFGSSTQGVPLTVTYQQLATALDPRDDDSTFLTFVVTSISNSTLKKGTVSMTTHDASTGLAPATSALIAPNESVVVFPTATVTGSATELFKVRVWDGESFSTDPANTATIKADLTAFNQKPILTYVKPFSGISEGGNLVFSYNEFRSGLVNGVARTNAYDAEEALPTTSLKFRVKSILSGSLAVNGGAALSAGADLAPGDQWKWTPAANANGALNAFTVVALDSSLAESDTPVTVVVNVGSKPTFASTADFAGGSEDLPYNITYNSLAANFPGQDDQGTPLGYEITAVVGGQLFKGATELTGNPMLTAVVIRPGDVLTWIPAAYSNNISNGGAISAFKMKLLDDSGNRSSEVTVKVNVASVNNLPVVQSVNPLTGVSKNSGKAISHADIWGLMTVKDYDFAGGTTTASNVSFRVESVPAGKLYLGSSVLSGETNRIQPSQSSTSSMPMLVNSGANGTTSTSNLYWMPPENGVGTFTVMRLRAYDGTDYAATATDITVTISAANATPTWSATTVTLPSATSQNGALPVTYETLAALTSPSDADGETLRLKVTSITTGSVLISGTSYSGTPATPPSIGPGETLYWRPGSTTGASVTAFSIKATDGTAETATSVTVVGSVNAVNSAPTLNAAATLTGALRNQWFEVKFADLVSGLSIADAETAGTALTIKVEQPLSGQGLKIGNSSNATPTPGSDATATVWSASTNYSVTNGKSVWWKPAANQAGTFPAFTVSVIDGGSMSSANIGTVNVTVTGSNAAPTMTAGNLDLGTFAQGSPIALTYNQLATQFAPVDDDSPLKRFVITSITSAVLKKGSTTLSAVAISGGQPGVPDSTNIISPDESLLILPSAAANASPATLFTVKAWDGDLYTSNSGSVRAIFTAANNNLVPVLSIVRDFTGATKDTVFAFTYSSLRSGGTPARSDAFDAEEALPTQTLKFKVKSIYSTNGTLCAGTDATCATALVANQLIEPTGSNASFNWKPATGLTGRLKAFSIVAYDGTDESSNPVDVYFQVTGPNEAPTLAAGPAINGAYEDVPFNITYDMVRNATVTSDDQAGPVKYKITNVYSANGTLTKSGSAVVAGTTLLSVAEMLNWTPTAYSNGAISAFKVKAVDDQGLESSEQIITVNVTAVNNLPSITAQSTLTAPAKNTGITWSYSTINSLMTIVDPDYTTAPAAGTFSYRIERAGAGTLYQGTTNGGTQITSNLAVASMPILKNTTVGNANAITDIYWMPPANGVGEFTVMTVRVGDGTDYGVSTWDIKVTISSANSAPTWSSAVATAGNVTLSTGTNKNGAIYISYDTLKTLTGLSDSDGQVPSFKISAVNSGTVSVNNAAAVATVSTPYPTVAAGESLVWRPAANASGTGLSAFSVTGTDGTADTATAVIVKANVSATNITPVIGTTTATFTGGSRNGVKTIAFSDLATALNISDDDNATNTLVFHIEGLVTGQSLKFGATLGAASSYPSGTNNVATANNFYWEAPKNQLGTFDAFKVTVVDPSGMTSPQVALVRVTVDTGSNAQPVLAAASNTYDLGSRGQGLPVTISYDDLKTATNASDSDSAYISFVITELTNSTIKKGSTTMTATTVSSTTTPTPDATSLISPNESFVVTPTPTLTGNDKVLFKVRAWDGAAYSDSATQVSVILDLVANNQTPVLTYVRDFTAGVKNTVYAFTYDQLRGDPTILDGSQRTNATDSEEALPTKSLMFKVKTIYSGSLCTGADTSCATPLSAPQTINPADSFRWKPATDAVGRLKAFSLVAWDGTLESTTPVDVYFQVAASNSAPVLGTVSTITGASEDVPFNISYAMLQSKVPVTDDQAGPVDYKITSVLAGTLVKNYSSAVVAGTTTLSVNETLTWTPVQYSNGSIAAFKVKGVDSSGLESSEATVTIFVTAVNNPPTITATPGSLTAPAKNAATSFSYANINSLFTVTDPDLASIPVGTMSYRIESFGGAGTLTAGSTSGGAVINPNGTAASMYTLMQSPSGASTNISAVYWQAPNMAGTYKLMTVRVFDGTDYAATSTDIYITIAASNSAPSVGAVTTITTTNGTSENAALPISYANLHSQIAATDADNDVIRYKIMSIQSGTLAVNGAAAISSVTVGSEPVLSTGQSLVWTPAADVSGSGLGAFTVKAYDGTADSSGSVTVKVNVSAVNSAPTMTNTTTTFTSVTRNTVKEITYSALATALGISDVEDGSGSPLKFSVTSLISGQTLSIGTSGNSAGAAAYNPATNKDVSSTQSLYWLPPANQTGIYQAFKVVVVDSGNVSSSREATVSMNIDTGTNSKPVLAAVSNTYDLGSRGKGLPIQLTYDQLKTAVSATDTDNDYISFVVTSLDNSTTIGKGSSTLAAVTVSSDTSPVPLSTNIIAPNETITVYPSAGITLNSLQNLFKIRAWDGQIYSLAASEVTVKATFTTTNSVPTLTYVKDFTTGTKDTNFVFSYDELRGDPTITNGTQRTDAYDAEEVIANKTLKFRVKAINASSYLCLNTAATCNAGTSAPDKLSAGSDISTGVTYKWVPPTGATGRVNAFDVVVYDGTAESVTTIPVYVWLKASNTTPSISGTLPFSGGVEDVPFAISWDSLRNNYPYSDDQSGPVRVDSRCKRKRHAQCVQCETS
ncbi:hypothetical protein EBU99_12020, partial [bacterium]|nr:hypothetical protein [bacterium]